ncbi:MAG: MoxR family ATPase [Clostridiales bacterium]|nr:MoxR family ATPase [Clostridiales bacterium]
MNILLDFLREQKVSETLIRELEHFRNRYPVNDGQRLATPSYLYYGKDIWEQALTALLCGENLLLAGSKATGKNVLAENLATAFGRPRYNISFHINMDATYMIGTDTFQNGQVTFRPGPVYQCATDGGFCILDEINMARNEALAVLHSVLDFRRMIDVPGYQQISLHEATRFIATMNYGYAGTRELNEALASRFVIIQTPEISEENLNNLLVRSFPKLQKKYREQFVALFIDINKKCENGELTMKALDLRGLLDALKLMEAGLAPRTALDMGITNKTFDSCEQEVIRDIIAGRISGKLTAATLFGA